MKTIDLIVAWQSNLNLVLMTGQDWSLNTNPEDNDVPSLKESHVLASEAPSFKSQGKPKGIVQKSNDPNIRSVAWKCGDRWFIYTRK